MKKSNALAGAILACTAIAVGLQAQSVLLMPGAGSSSATIPVYNVTPFTAQTAITDTSRGPFQVLAKPDGTKYYVITNTGAGGGVYVYDRNFLNGRAIGGGLTNGPTYATLSPDGRRLLILAGGLYIFDTANDTLINSVPLALTGNLVEIAFSIDSTRAFVLGNSANAGVITPVDLATNSPAAGQALVLAGAGAGIVTGPNGLLYVTTLNRLFEINPRTLTVTPSGEVPVNASPGKPVFSPDGRYALAINRTPITGSSVVLFDLLTHTVAGSPLANFGVVFDRLVVAGPNRVFAYSSENLSNPNNTTLYEITYATGLSVNPSVLNNSLPKQVRAFTITNEVPSSTMFALATNEQGLTYLYKVDLVNNQVVGQIPATDAAGQVVAIAAINPTSGGSTMTLYNVSQVLTGGGTTLPLVARVLDSLGRPVAGVRVDFATVAASITLSSTAANTNSDGYAQVFATVANSPGTNTITASTPGAPSADFSVTVPGGGGGGGGGGTTLAAIKIKSGNGQIIQENFRATQALTVVLTNADGTPAVGSSVVFSITQGKGTIIGGSSISLTTDAKGEAATDFLAGLVATGLSYEQTTVNAATAIGGVNFTLTTFTTKLPDGTTVSAPGAIVDEPSLEKGRRIKGGAGQLLKGAIRVKVYAASGPQAGLGIPNVAMSLLVPEGSDPKQVPSATCANDPLTDASGIGLCDVLLGNVLGNGLIRVNIGGYAEAQLFLEVNVGPPNIVTKVGGDGQTGSAGGTLGQPLRIRVTDSANNPLPNIPLTWRVTSGIATLTATNTQTDVNGNASTTVTLGSNPGKVTITVTAGTATNAPFATFDLTVRSNVGSITVTGGNNQIVNAGAAFPQALQVRVINDQNQPMSGVAVSFAVASGTATLSANTATTDTSGLASVTATAGSTPGPVLVTASVGNATARFDLTIRTPGPPVNSASFASAASGAPGLTPCGIGLVSAAGLIPGIQGVLEANSFVGPLPTTLGGADLSINGVAAPIFWVTNSAIAFQTPCETPAGTTSVVVRVAGGTTTVQVPVVTLQPGIFESVNSAGRRQAVLLRADGSFVTPENPARRGEQLKMFTTGMGSVSPATATGRAGIGGQTVDAPITVGVNNAGVRFISAEYLYGAVGIYVITFEVPADTQTGPAQNLGLVLTGADGSAVYAPGSFLPIGN